MQQKQIIIAGAGLTGSLLAIHLARLGHTVSIYERRTDMRAADISAGRSINLAISERGLYALEQVGLRDSILSKCIPMRNRVIHDLEGNMTRQPYGRNQDEHINALSRAELNILLMDQAEKEKVQILFEHNVVGVDLMNKKALIRDEKTSKECEFSFDLLFSSEGGSSRLRKDILNQYENAETSIEELGHSYKELVIPATTDGLHRIEKEALHIWPRKDFMLIALPNLDGSFTVTLFLPNVGSCSFESIKTDEQLEHFFNTNFPDAATLIPDLKKAFFENPTGHLATIRCYPWSYKDCALLIGDSAHAIVPFFGQGMNACFEDCTQLMKIIHEQPDDWNKIFENYQTQRKPNADAIAQMAIENYVEMRDHTGDPKFLLAKQIEQQLMKTYPDKYFSKYNLVTFNRVPYSFALKCGEEQKILLSKLTQNISVIDQFKLEDHSATIEDYFDKLEKLQS